MSKKHKVNIQKSEFLSRAFMRAKEDGWLSSECYGELAFELIQCLELMVGSEEFEIE